MSKFNVALNAEDNPLVAASVSFASNGDNIVVAASPGQVIRVFRLVLVITSAVSVTAKDGALVSLSGAMPFAANAVLQLPFDTKPHYVTAAGNAFILNLSSGVQVSGTIYYSQS